MESGLVGLRAELQKKRSETTRLGAGGRGLREAGRPTIKSTSSQAANAGVAARDTRDRQQLEEDRITESKSKAVLEEKAAMYDRLHGGVEVLESDSLNHKYLINFQKKIVDKVLANKKDRNETENKNEQLSREAADPKLYKASDDADEWVEYTDAFGRTRECMRKDLPDMLEKDKELARSINQEEEEEAELEPELVVEDLHRELQRQKWETQEQLNAQKKDVHYQDVLFDEARDHGPGFMKFASDEAKRKEQMDLLKELRAETQRGEAARSVSAAKKQKLLNIRLEKVRQRKRLKLGLPAKEDDKLKTPPASDDEGEEEEEGAAPETIPRQRNPDTEGMTSRPQQKKRQPVREWDLGKEGVKCTLTQEEWVDRQRTQRNTEFAPPSAYEPQTKSRYYHKPNMTVDGSRQPQNPSSCHTSRSYSPPIISAAAGEAGETGEGHHRDNRQSQFAPPATYEYYGPSTTRRQHFSRPRESVMEAAITKGLAELRKQC